MKATVLVTTVEGINVANSRQLADMFGKEHKNVIRDLELIIEKSDGSNLSSEIIKSVYINTRGKEYKEYLLTQDGFQLYMMNILGYVDEKLAYIKQFNEMQGLIKQIATRELTEEEMILKAMEILQTKTITLTNKVVELEDVIEVQKEKVECYNTLTKASGYIDMKNLAAVINLKGYGRNNLLELMRRIGILMVDNLPYRTYIEQGYFRMVVKTIPRGTGKPLNVTVPLVSAKGVAWVTKRVFKAVHKLEQTEVTKEA